VEFSQKFSAQYIQRLKKILKSKSNLSKKIFQEILQEYFSNKITFLANQDSTKYFTKS